MHMQQPSFWCLFADPQVIELKRHIDWIELR
jgi:hypothetical protein